MNTTRLIVALSVALCVTVVVGSYVAIHNSDRLDAQQQELRNGLISGCKKNGNPLRAAVRGQLREQIKQSSNTKVLRTFFPQIPRSQLIALVAKSIARDKAEIKQIAPVDCAALYK